MYELQNILSTVILKMRQHMPPEWIYPGIRLQGITTRMMNTSKFTTTKKCIAIFMFSAGTKIVYERRYMFGSLLNLITDIIFIYLVPCILLHFQRFITYSWLVILFCILVKQD